MYEIVARKHRRYIKINFLPKVCRVILRRNILAKCDPQITLLTYTNINTNISKSKPKYLTLVFNNKKYLNN